MQAGAGATVGTAVGSTWGPVGGAIGGAVGNALDGGGGGGGGFAPSSSTTGGVEDFSRINIQPVGINFGAIMQPMMEPTNTGGLGVFPSSRWLNNDSNALTSPASTSLPGLQELSRDWRIPAVLFAAAVAGFFIFKKKRG